MRTRRLGAVLLTACVLLVVAPATAHAANAFGRTYLGQARCLSCHADYGLDVYTGTKHGQMITDVVATSGALVPAATSNLWPSPTWGNGLRFNASDIWLLAGSPGGTRELITKTMGGNGISPADDYPMIEGATWNGQWECEAVVTVWPYFQRCGGCHNLGLTRPSADTTTLPNGTTISPSTPTSWAGLSIQCENCHGTGKASSDCSQGGESVIRSKRMLAAENCGQCHVNGTAKQRRLGSTSKFSNANGYTPDETLTDYFDISLTVPTSYSSTDGAKFYPSGHNRGMHHGYYNEWKKSPHAQTRQTLRASSHASAFCMRCHSAEGYLKSKNYGFLGLASYTVSLTGDAYDITCPACHVVHNYGSGDALGLRGSRSTICQGCHTSSPPPAGFTPGSVVHHPQSEMFAGRGLLDVPNGAVTMAGAECPDCHMPVTTSTRKSHSFKPMLPGDAVAWNVQANGDSCSRCHTPGAEQTPTEQREYLQDELDKWETALSALTAQADSAYAAANARKRTTVAADMDLTKRAFTNISFVKADGSKGAHNFAYAKAGLEKAIFFAKSVRSSLTFESTRGNYMLYGQPTVLFGQVKFGTGAAAAGQLVTIQKKTGTGAWMTLRTVRANDDGFFALKIYQPRGYTYYRTVFTPRSRDSYYSRYFAISVR